MYRRQFLIATSATALAAALPPERGWGALPPAGAAPAGTLPAPLREQARPAPMSAPARHDRYLWPVRRGYPVRL